jgi:multiple sugar transport system permease protein
LSEVLTSKKKQFTNAFLIFLVIIFVIIYLIPIYWMIITSLRPEAESLSWPPKLYPTNLVLDNYKIAFGQKSILFYIKNSMIIAVLSVLLSMVIGSLAAYSFARMKWKKHIKTNIILFVITLRIMPPIAVAIPLFLIFVNLRMIDTYQGVIIAYTFFNLPFVIWLTYGFFKDLPGEIVEAALIDGCGLGRLFFNIIIPLTRSGLVTVMLLTFMTSWNEFLFAIKLTSFKTRTIPVLISGFIVDRGLLWGQICAVGTISIIPVALIALFIQRYIVSGLTFGSVK